MAQNTDAATKAEQWQDPPTEPLSAQGSGVFERSWFVPQDTLLASPPSQLSARVRAPARLWSYLMRARVVIATALLLLQVFIVWRGGGQPWLLGLCLGYQVATAAVLRWARPAQTDSVWSPRWALTLWVDLGVFALLHLFGEAGLNYTPLFALPVLLAAMLGPVLLALGSAATATLVLLFEAWRSGLAMPATATNHYLQAALTGLGFFLVALLASQLARRLIREQAQALRSQILARTESQISSLIASGLKEGVLVFNARGDVWHANTAAYTMLDAPSANLSSLQHTPGWPMLLAWVQSCQWLSREADSDIAIATRQGGSRNLRVRARLVQPHARQRMEPACVVFLEDLRDVEARVQTEKLAAMGRLSAAVAHEIRNPLAAIAQANALLAEDSTDPAQQRLITMIGQNAKRLGRTVDDILNVVRSGTPAGQEPTAQCNLTEQVPAMAEDWRRTTPQRQVQVQAPAQPVTVRFDEEHLRRVLCNLLDNAHKHSPIAAPPIYLQVEASGPNTAVLRVWNAGPALPQAVAQHLFEPFSSSSSRSSGLGLYICQELCQNHQAHISYARQHVNGQEGHAFTVWLRRTA